jgi:lysophospholipase L1-like esterase
MNQTNHKILTLSKWNAALYYVNTATPMLQLEGLPNPGLFVDDELHLNTAGYSLWSQILKNRLDHTFNLK